MKKFLVRYHSTASMQIKENTVEAIDKENARKAIRELPENENETIAFVQVKELA